jgi:hypothetical protein
LKNTDYPYRAIPDYRKIFEFMTKVLPENGSYNGTSLPYLNDPSNPNYLKPADGETGWKGVKLNGFREIYPSGTTGMTMVKYAKDNASTKPYLEQQIEPYVLPDNLSFKSLVNLW